MVAVMIWYGMVVWYQYKWGGKRDQGGVDGCCLPFVRLRRWGASPFPRASEDFDNPDP